MDERLILNDAGRGATSGEREIVGGRQSGERKIRG